MPAACRSESYTPKGVLELTNIDVFRLLAPHEGAALLLLLLPLLLC